MRRLAAAGLVVAIALVACSAPPSLPPPSRDIQPSTPPDLATPVAAQDVDPSTIPRWELNVVHIGRLTLTVGFADGRQTEEFDIPIRDELHTAVSSIRNGRFVYVTSAPGEVVLHDVNVANGTQTSVRLQLAGIVRAVAMDDAWVYLGLNERVPRPGPEVENRTDVGPDLGVIRLPRSGEGAARQIIAPRDMGVEPFRVLVELALTPDGRNLVSASCRQGGEGCAITVFDIATEVSWATPENELSWVVGARNAFYAGIAPCPPCGLVMRSIMQAEVRTIPLADDVDAFLALDDERLAYHDEALRQVGRTAIHSVDLTTGADAIVFSDDDDAYMFGDARAWELPAGWFPLHPEPCHRPGNDRRLLLLNVSTGETIRLPIEQPDPITGCNG